MTRSPLLFGVTLGLLAAAGGAIVLPAAPRAVPLVAPLDDVPVSVGGWVGSSHVPQDLLPVDPKVSAHLGRTYQNGTETVWVSVSYFPIQAEGRRPLVEPLLDPSRGSNQLLLRKVRVPLDGGSGRSIPANLLVIRQAESRRAAILYWYQVQGHSIASDHWYRALLIYNRLVHRRADGALVRVATVVPESTTVGAVVDQEMRFIRAFYPELLRSLPR